MTDDLRTLTASVAELCEVVNELTSRPLVSDPRMTVSRPHLATRAEAVRADVAALKKRLDKRAPDGTTHLTAERLDIVEPDGTVRLTISSEARMPTELVLGEKRYPHERKVAGILYNDEGAECGGLTFHGSHEADGGGQQMVNLSFDQLDQDQVIQLLGQGPGERTGLIVTDRSDVPLGELGETHDQAWPDEHRPHRRMYAGKEDDASVLELSDPQGRVRVALRVDPDGTPSVRLYDDAGNVTHSMP